MEILLFLDIDGVLNDHDGIKIDKLAINIFNQIVEKYSPKIVLSSAWRYFVHNGLMTKEGLRWLFITHGLSQNAILFGITRKDKYFGQKQYLQERVDQIVEHIESLGLYDKYIVLDDLDLPRQRFNDIKNLHFERTEGNKGLTEENLKNIIDFLEKK